MTVREAPSAAARHRFWLAVLVLGAWALAAPAADPPKPAKGDKPAPAEEAPRGADGQLAFSFNNAPWTQVLEWFADNTGLAFVGNYKPAGTFTFVPPKVDGKLRTYNIGEIVDILNEALQVNSSNKRYLLIRRSQSFTLVIADDKIPRDLIPSIRVEDLPKRGRSEVVRIDVKVAGADAEELAPKIKKMMTQLGDAVALDSPNMLVLIDTVGSLTEVMKTIKLIGGDGKETAERYAHQCRFIKAHDAERVLKELFGLPPTLPPEMAVWAQRMNLERQMQMQMQQQHGQGGQGRPPAPKPPRQVAVASSDESNMVIVTGPPDKVAEAKQTLTDLEEKAKAAGAKEQPVGPAMVKRYAVPGGDAQALAQMLQEKYRSSPSVRVINLGPNELMVSAPPADQFDIATLVSEGVGSQKVKVIPLKNGDGWMMEDTLRGMFGDRYKVPRAPYIEARTKTAITVQGTDEQIAQVEQAVKVLDVPSDSFAPGGLHVISLDRGSGAAVAEELQRLLKEMGKDAKVIGPGAPAEPKKPDKPSSPDTRDDKAGPRKDAKLVTTGEPAGPAKPPLFDPRGENKEPPKEKKGGGIVLIPYGGQISVKSDNPEDQKMIEQLIDLITAKTGNEEFEVVKLKNTNAIEVARLLDEMYNGPRRPQQPQQPQMMQPQQPQQPQQQPPPGGPPVGGFPGHSHAGAGGGSGSTGSSSSSSSFDRIRVLADPNLNAVLLRAAPIDALTIKKLIRDQLDQPAQQVIKNHVVKLKTANAADVSSNIRELYRQVMDVNPLPGQPGSDRLGYQIALSGNPNIGRPVDVNGVPRAASLTIGVDERSNSLLVQCSDALFEEVKKLADDLDEAAKNPNRRVQVRFTRGLDPTLVQQVVDSIQGRRPTTPPGGGGGVGGGVTPTPGFNRPIGGFGGGLQPIIGGGLGGLGVLAPGGGRVPGGGGLRP
jgi:type II secretory pathway component GspD/PulD (secretin)